MKKIFFFIVFLLALSYADASDNDIIYEVEEIITKTDIISKIELKASKTDYSLQFATADLSFVPMEKESQDIISIDYFPKPEEIGADSVLFRWEDQDVGEHEYKIESEVVTRINRKEVKEKVDFPIKGLSDDYVIYTEPTANIDSNDPDIVRIASQLAEGEDDLYIVVNKLVSWIKENIKYTLDTATEKISQPASWVIRSKYGVCDEITSLFIAMARSLGIPAKFVSGMAYTNWNNLNDWGPHAWAEVYYPEIGWVSYDITYNEFGYVDASHIVLKESLDSNESSTHYEWRGRNVDLIPEKIQVSVELLEKRGKAEDQVAIDVNLFKDEVGFGGYTVVEADIENLQDYYVSEDITIAKVKEMEVLGRMDHQIVLKPKEIKKIFWLIRVSEDLDRGFIYTLPVSIYTSRNTSGKSSIKSTFRSKEYDREGMQAYIDEKTEEEQKKYSKDISLECKSTEKIYLEEELKIDCEVWNEGNIYIEDLDVCLFEECESLDLGISKSAHINYSLVMYEAGEQDYSIKASNKDVSKIFYISATVYDKPDIEITELSENTRLKFGDTFELKFIIEKTSLSNPLGTEITITRGKTVNRWDFGELLENQDFLINFDTKQMAKENRLKIKVAYKDEKGNAYYKEKEVFVEVEADRLFDKVKMWFNGLFG